MGIRIIQTSDPLNDPAVGALKEALRSGELVASGAPAGLDVRKTVAKAIEGVRTKGDRYVIRETARLHLVKLKANQLRVTAGELQAAGQATVTDCPDFLPLMRRAIANIRRYQESILLKAPPPLVRDGRAMGVRYTPIDRVAVYVPAGRASYPSSVLMTVVPAQVAGVPEIAMVSPPTWDGDIQPMILALAGELGIDEVYRASGVAGLAAVALGTESIRPVAKIVGPGSAFISEAKRQLFGRVGIDMIAGPSEVLIIADDTAPADWVAADLLAQAEHDPGSAILVTNSRSLAEKVSLAIERQLPALARRIAIEAALDRYSAAIVVGDLAAACDLSNDLAPEHLQIITADDDATLAKIRNAGAIFLGPQTPVVLGDYYAGPSHVLPTGGTARFSGPLSCNDFLKATSTIRYDAGSMAQDAADVAKFAAGEGLGAHARAAEIRTEGS